MLMYLKFVEHLYRILNNEVIVYSILFNHSKSKFRKKIELQLIPMWILSCFQLCYLDWDEQLFQQKSPYNCHAEMTKQTSKLFQPVSWYLPNQKNKLVLVVKLYKKWFKWLFEKSDITHIHFFLLFKDKMFFQLVGQFCRFVNKHSIRFIYSVKKKIPSF